MSVPSSKQEFLDKATGRTRFSELINSELRSIVNNDCAYPLGSIFVCGRFGAGKSTFSDYWQGSDFFPSVYHIDTDHLMRKLHDMGYTPSRSDTRMCGDLLREMFGMLSEMNIPYTYSFAGRQAVTPVQHRVSKNIPGYSALTDAEKIVAKPTGHMVLCDTEVSLARVRQRQAAGGHPYQELTGEFEDKYIYKQAEIIYGLPFYAAGTDSYFIWDSSESGKQKMIAEIIRGEDGVRQITIHDSERADHFGLTQENMRILFNLYDDYEFLYTKIFGRVVAHEFGGEVRDLFDETCDGISRELMASVLDDLERPLLQSAANNEASITFEEGEKWEINVFERPINFECMNNLAVHIAKERQNYEGGLVQMPPQAT